MCVTAFADRCEDKIFYPVSLQINQRLIDQYVFQIRERVLIDRIELRKQPHFVSPLTLKDITPPQEVTNTH